GLVYRVNTDGTGFSGPNGLAGGGHGGVIVSTNVIYGATYTTVFKMNTDGTGFVVLKNFSGNDGLNGYSRLTLSGNVLYGAKGSGGEFGQGTLFKLDLTAPPLLTIQSLGNAVVLNWSDSAFALQEAPTPMGVYTNIPAATSPYTIVVNGRQAFFRLIGN